MYNLLNFKIENLVKEFNSDIQSGLTTHQHNINLEKFGPNKIDQEEFSGLILW